MSNLLALGALALLALGGSKKTSTVPPKGKTPAPSDGGAGDAVNAVIEAGVPLIVAGIGALGGGGAAGGGAVIGGKAAGDVAGAGGAVKGAADTAAWGVPATVAGVSTGFLVVAGLWAVALVAGLVFSALLAPEMARRGTMGRLYGATYGSFAWNAGRNYWANLVANRYGLRVAGLRWPSLGTAWGELTTKGYLPVVVRENETVPATLETDYPDDVYEVYRWAPNRPVPNVALAIASVDAHKLAEMWTLGMVSAVKAAGRFIGEVADQSAPHVDPFYFTGDGLLIGLFSEAQAEWAVAAGRVPRLEEQRAAWLQGVQDGLAFVRSNAWGVGGQYLLADKGNAAQSIAATLVAWQPNFVAPVTQPGRQAKFVSTVQGSGASFRVFLDITNDEGDSTFVEVKL